MEMEKEVQLDCVTNKKNICNWENITNEFRSASQNLYHGELVHFDTFALVDAMSCIELMEPKMDAGMLWDRKKTVLGFEDSISAGLVKVNNFTFEEKIGIIDETYACLATWLNGHSLIQTVCTNLYLHDPKLINDRFLRIFSFVILKIIGFIRNTISNGNVSEEGDLQLNISYLNCHLLDSKVSSMIKDLEDDLCKKIKGLNKFKGDNYKENCGNQVNMKDTNFRENSNNEQHFSKKQLDFKYYSALYTRIQITRAFYQYFLNINRQILEINNLNGKKRLKNLIGENFFLELYKKMQICENNIDDWISTIDLGAKAKEEKTDDFKGDYPTIMGFSPLVNQRHFFPTFPKYIKILSRESSMKFFKNLFLRLKNILQIEKFDTFKGCLLFCDQLSKDCDFQSCICSRSTLQVFNTLQPNNNLDIENFPCVLRDDIFRIVKLIILRNKKKLEFSSIEEYLKIFFARCCAPMSKLLHATGLNRAKQREKLKVILPELSDLYDDAEKLDIIFNMEENNTDFENFQVHKFSSWILYYLIRAMIQYLLLGFELELISEHEYSYIYWYLGKHLIKKMVSNLNDINALFCYSEPTDNKQQKSKNLNKTKQNKEPLDDFLNDEISIYKGMKHLTKGLYVICRLLMKKNVIKQPRIIAENHHILYTHRLAPFINISFPMFIDHTMYQESMKLNEILENPEYSLFVATTYFVKATEHFITICNNKEVESLIKIAKTNTVVTKLILHGHKQLENLKLDFTEHKSFAILKLVEI